MNVQPIRPDPPGDPRPESAPFRTKSERREMPLFELSPGEFRTLQESHPGDPELEMLLKRRGISYDMGNIVVEVVGKRRTVTTAKEDFGTEVN